MGKADRFTDLEIEYIKAAYPQLGPTAISRKLGRSLSAVKARIKELDLKNDKPTNKEPKPSLKAIKQLPEEDRTSRLLELRDILHTQLTDINTPSNCIAAICREYRATLEEIEKLTENSSQASNNPLEEIAKAVVDGLRS